MSKDSVGGSWGNNKIKFKVYADRILVAERKQLGYPEKEFIMAEIPKGTSKMKFVTKAVGKLIVNKKPTGYEINSVGEYTFKGLSNAEKVEVLVDGKVAGSAIPNKNTAEWKITVDFKETKNHLVVIRSIIGENVIMTDSFDYIMNDDVIYASYLEVTKTTGLGGQYKVFKGGEGGLSVGGNGTYATTFGFKNHPLNGESNNFGAADIDIDIEGLGYRYFRTVVGKNDAVVQGGTGVEFIVLVDSVMMTRSGNLDIGTMACLACDIPADAKKLTLRVTNFDGKYEFSTSDWCDPILAREKTMIEKTVNMYEGTEKSCALDLTEGVALQFRAKYAFDALVIPHSEKLQGVTEVKLYKYTGSYFETVKRTPSLTMTAGAGSFAGVITPKKPLPAGEYLVVLTGEGELDCYPSKTMVIYKGRESKKIAPALALSFAGVAEVPYFTAVIANVGDGSAPANTATDKEIKEAQETYEGYLADNLKNFPVTMKIGDKTYTGFGDAVFSFVSQNTVKNHRYGNETTTVLKYTPTNSTLAPVTFTVVSVFYPEYAAYDWTVYFENADARRNTPVISGIKSVVTFMGEDPYVLGTNGDPNGFTEKNFAVSELAHIIAPTDGRSTNDAFPYWNLEYGQGGALIAVGWAGQWQASYQKSGEDSETITTFINGQQTFSSYLKPGEKARTPLTAIVNYEGRIPDRATNLWRRFMVDCNMSKVNEDGSTVTPMILGTTHEYFNEMTFTNEAKQLAALRHFVESGADIDLWWMDAGWYFGADGKTGIDGNWWNTGSWTIDTKRFPNGLKTVAEYAQSVGKSTMLWFEPERVGNRDALQTDGSTLNPEWVFDSGLVDYSNPEAVDWLIERICSILDSINASVYREDFNMSPLPTWMMLNEKDAKRQGITENLHIQGHFRLWDAIAERFPGIILDSCASGGRRNDLESMRRAVPLHRTDNQYGNSPLQQCYTWGYSEWIPYFGSKADSDGPNGDVERTKIADKYCLRRALVPSMELNYSPYDPLDWYKIQKACAEQRTLSQYYLKDFYQLTGYTQSQTDWMAWMYYDTEAGHGYANIWRRTEASATHRILLKGLKADTLYDVWFEDRNSHQVISGDVLMYDGIEVTLPAKRSNDLMYISEVGNGRYVARDLTVTVTEPSVGDFMGQLAKAVHSEAIDGIKYYSFALRFNMTIRDTVLNRTNLKGEGYIEYNVEKHYADLVTVNGTKLSELLSADKDAVQMYYDVYHNVMTVYVKQGSIENFGPGKENTVTVSREISTFEGVALTEDVTYRLGSEDSKWTLAE